VALLHGRAGRLTAKNGDFRPGQNRQGTSRIFGAEVQRYEEPWCKGLAKGTYCIGPPMVLLTFNHTILNCSHAGADGEKTVCESGQYCGHDPTGDPVGQVRKTPSWPRSLANFSPL
jgi:hypothetical protein